MLNNRKLMLLYLLLSLYYHSENIPLLESLFPVESTYWNRASKLTQTSSKSSFLTLDQLYIKVYSDGSF